MRWLQWFGDHVGLAFVVAALWFLAVLAGYIAWVVWGGWETDRELALAQALVPIAFSGFGLVVVCAAVLAFRPPQPELSCFVQSSGLGSPVFMIANSGHVPASEVVIELDGAPIVYGPRILLPFWEEADVPVPFILREDSMARYSVFKRRGSLPNGRQEGVFTGWADGPVTVHLTASNATPVLHAVSQSAWGDEPRPS